MNPTQLFVEPKYPTTAQPGLPQQQQAPYPPPQGQYPIQGYANQGFVPPIIHGYPQPQGNMSPPSYQEAANAPPLGPPIQ